MNRIRATGILALAAIVAACDEPAQTVSPDLQAQFAKGGNSQPGFVTSQPSQANLLVSGGLTPLATAGDVMPGGEQLVGLPDGIGVWGGDRYINMYLNHEISGGARVSRFLIDAVDLEIDLHEYTFDGSEGYSRLCSAEWVDAGDGFPGGYFFTGEEQSDGLQIAIDAQGRVTELPWIGLYAHENQISVPGFPGHVVVLNFDDNGGSGVGRDGARSELYMYAASSTQQVLSGEGQLYVFAADDSDLFPNDLSVNVGIPGHWVPVPADIPGDFVALEAFNDDAEVLAFPFIRLEDGFYDKRPGVGPSAYFFDTGRGSIRDVGGDVVDLWGSIYRLDFEDPNDPAGGTATLVLLGRSDGPATGWASPDNGDMDSSGRIMLQEDPAVSPWEPAAGVRPPAIFQLQLAADGTLVDPVGTKVAEVAGGDCSPGADNCWETSGIVDASQWFGDNTWIFDVQAHDEPVANCPDCVEAGQLLLMEID
jgi:hypothetical protein